MSVEIAFMIAALLLPEHPKNKTDRSMKIWHHYLFLF